MSALEDQASERDVCAGERLIRSSSEMKSSQTRNGSSERQRRIKREDQASERDVCAGERLIRSERHLKSHGSGARSGARDSQNRAGSGARSAAGQGSNLSLRRDSDIHGWTGIKSKPEFCRGVYHAGVYTPKSLGNSDSQENSFFRHTPTKNLG